MARPVAVAQPSSRVPQSTPTATAKIEATVLPSSWTPALPASPATWVSPMRPRAPGTSSQKPGRKDAWGGSACGSRDTQVATGVITSAPTKALSDCAEEDVAGDLAGPGDVEDDEEARERSSRRGVGHHHPDGEHQHTDPRRPRTQLVPRAPQHVRERDADRLDAGDDPEGEQRQLHDARDQAARAGHGLPGGQLEHGCREGGPGEEDDQRGDHGAQPGPGEVLLGGQRAERRHHERGEDRQDDLQGATTGGRATAATPPARPGRPRRRRHGGRAAG